MDTDTYCVRYIKYKEYIITIQIRKYLIHIFEKNDNENVLCSCSTFRVLSIEHIATKEQLNNIYYEYNNYEYNASNFMMEVNKDYDVNISYYKTYKRAFDENFIEEKQYLLFPNGYSGEYNNYYDSGNVLCKYFHENGIINGLYTEFFDNNKIKLQCEYVNGKLHGEFKKYHDTGNINIHAYYNNNNLVDTYEVYNINNILTYKALYNDGKLLNYTAYHPISGELYE